MKAQRFKTLRVSGIRFVLLALALTWATGPAFAQDHPARVRALVIQLGLADEARHQLESRIYTLREARPDVFGEFWVEFMATVRTQPLVDSLTSHFAGALTAEDVAALEQLAATQGGVKALKAWTAAMPEAAALAQHWRATVDRRLDEELAKLNHP